MVKDKNQNNANREYKDSVFVDLFSLEQMTRKEAIVSLYNALHEEKIAYKDEVKFVRLEDVLFRKVRSDISFIVNDRLIVLLEHQSTNININHPDNKDFLKGCPLLNGYKKFTEIVEKYKVLYGNEGYAMAIEEYIKENIEISGSLKHKMWEVMEMLTAEYSCALELEAARKDGKKEGINKGLSTTTNRMKKANFDTTTIVQMTGLSSKVIEKL